MSDEKIVKDAGAESAPVKADEPTKDTAVTDVKAAKAEAKAEAKAAAEEAAAQPYELQEWHGLPKFVCKYCPWDTVDGEERFWEHYKGIHDIPQPVNAPTGSKILVADRFGNVREGVH